MHICIIHNAVKVSNVLLSPLRINNLKKTTITYNISLIIS